MASLKSTRTAIYLRISKDKTGQRAGVERQLADCQALAQRLGWSVIRVYTDNDISAFSGKRRPDYQQLCGDIKAGVINAVIAWHPDRLHRRSAELESWLDLVGDDIDHATVQAGLWDLSTPSGRMTARILGAVGQYESEHRSERVRAAKATDARNGKFGGGIRCFGYEPDGMTIRESEATEIRRIAEEITRGVSLRSMARELNLRAVPTVAGTGPWSQSKLRSVMLRPRLAGIRMHGEAMYTAAWPAILDATTFAAVSARLLDPARRTAGPRLGRTPTMLGTGIYVCGVCGLPTMRKAKGSKGQAIYRCGLTANGGRHVSRNATELDAFVTDALLARLAQPGYVAARAERRNITGDARQATLIAERDQIRCALDELATAAESGAVTAALALQLARQSSELTARAEQIGHELAVYGQQSPVAALIGTEDDLATLWEGLSLPVRRAILADELTVIVRPGKRGPGFDVASIDLQFHQS